MHRKIETQDILNHMELPSLPGVFVLGCFERRVTLYSQQVRALNLVYSLVDRNRLREGTRVLVIGAGAAGLTAAAAAGRSGAKVVVLETGDEVMHLLRGNHTRWLHPHIYDWPWPGAEASHANLPLLDWDAGMADDVVVQLESKWEALRRESGIDFQGGVQRLKRVSGQTREHDFTWNQKSGFAEGSFELVLIAVGFGRERPMPEGGASRSYWQNDDLHQPLPDTTRVRRSLVSGTGDGGLVDLLRVRLRSFRHDKVVSQFLSTTELKPVKEQLLVIEHDVDTLSLKALYGKYAEIDAPGLDEALKGRLRSDTSAVLNGLEAYPINPGACVLNRFLASRLLRWDVRYLAGRFAVSTEPGAPLTVSFEDGGPVELFEQLIRRHGPEWALGALLSWVKKEDLETLRARHRLDQTRVPLWPSGFCSARHVTPPDARKALSVSPGPAELPRRPALFGRDALTRELVDKLLASTQPVVVLGPPGIGKSSLTLAALHHPDIEGRYPKRRYFLRLDGVGTVSRLNSEIARVFNLSPGPELVTRLATVLGDGPVLLVLDNAEDPWLSEVAATEEFLTTLSRLPNLALLLSVRGTVSPLRVDTDRKLRVPPLERGAARDFFLSIVDEAGARDDPRVEEMLDAQEGLPLALSLLAHAAEGVALDWTYASWRRLGIELFNEAGSQDRQRSLAVSFELSLRSSIVGEQDKRLLSLLSCLPVGLTRHDLEPLFPEGPDAPRLLQKMGLAFDENGRLRVFAPLREYMRGKYPPSSGDWARITSHYTQLARQQGPRVGDHGGAMASKRLDAEVPNLEVVLLEALNADDAPGVLAAVDAVLGLNNFMRLSGLGSVELLEQARRQAGRLHDEAREARCRYALGQLLLRRSQHEMARPLFQETLLVFERLGDVHGQARCLQSLGSLALDDMKWEEARACFERAFALRQEMMDPRGAGNCLHGLGKACLGQGQREAARGYFQKAQTLFESCDHDLGRAHCLRSLGELDADPSQLERARSLFEKVGDVRGMGHCLRGLGDSARVRADWHQAQTQYQQARQFLQQSASVRGVAHCRLGQGLVAQARGEHREAREAFQHALELFRQVRDTAREKECLERLASG